jgi:putative oxidoreductase
MKEVAGGAVTDFKGSISMEATSERDLFAPILSSDALTGPFLLTGRLFMTGIFAFYICSELARIQPNVFLYIAIAVQLAGIVLIALGYKTRLAALVFSVGILATLLFRSSAGLTTGFEVTMLKDLAIAAGFLFLFAYGPGPLSLDARQSRSNSKGLAYDSDRSLFGPILRNNFVMGPLLFAGRVLASVVFFVYGTHKFLDTPATRVYMENHNAHVPTNLVYLAIITQFAFPLLVLLGYKTRYGALALAGFCLIATSLFHSDFSNHAEVEQFVLDFAITGGFFFMFAYGPGPFSLDAWRGRVGAEPKLASVKHDVSPAR